MKPKDMLRPGALLEGSLFRSFLERAGALEELSPGLRLGAFRLVEQIGRGGMGVVYRAERDDEEFRQSVAVKCVVDPGNALSAELFRKEREILAQLRHPNIARLLDGGRSEHGLLWFAMELIEGERIDHHCRARNLDLATRLGLFQGVLEAVQFAHSRLLIHRDIKPSNVLVDADGRPKLLDFGISSLSCEGGYTTAFSPGYASPEQLRGDEIGTASDQYQLALLLDAMLCAKPAAEVFAQRDTDPGRVQQLPAPRPERWIRMSSARRRDLGAILARALQVDPQHRYNSVGELSDEIARLLAHRPVEARRGGPLYAFGCAWRRRPVSMAMIVAIPALFLGSFAAYSVMITAERDFAQAQVRKVVAINEFVTDDLLGTASPYVALQPDLTVREALDRARLVLATRFAEAPLIEAEIRLTIGMAFVRLGQYDAAAAELAQAEALALAVSASSQVSADLLPRIRLAQATMARYASDYEAAERLLETLIRDAGVRGAHSERVTLEAESLLLEVLSFTGRIPQALEREPEVIARIERALGPDHDLMQRLLNGSGHRLHMQGRFAEAEETFARLAGLREREYGREHPLTLHSLNGLALVLREQNRLSEAESLLLEVLGNRERTFGRSHPEIHGAMNELAIVYSRQGRRDEAIALFRDALDVKLELLGEEHQATLTGRYNLAREIMLAGRLEESRPVFAELLEVERRTLGPDNPGTLVTQITLGELALRVGELDEALRVLDDALVRSETSLTGRPELGVLLTYYGETLAALERQAEAREQFARAVEILSSTVGPEHPRTIKSVELLTAIQ